MCGIVGLVNFEKRYHPERLKGLTLAMREAITHRGPDDAGLWMSDDGVVCLGHRRLSIVDLRPEGRQPMGNEDGSVMVTFNGEIYNYAALTAHLKQQGHAFRTRTDTEALCHLFEGDPERALRSREAGRALRSAMEAIPPRERLAVTLRYRDGMNARQAAMVLNVTPAEAERLAREGVRKVRESLGRAGMAQLDFEGALAAPGPP